ncbi:MAG: 6-phosphogluconolactonase [Pseudomonadota bacterium]
MNKNNSANFQWLAQPTAEAVAQIVYQQIKLLSQQAIKQRDQFKLVLAGGTTPGVVYKKLAYLATDWSKWQIYFGDERCVDIDDAERNSKMVMNNWLARVAIPAENIHIMPAELGAIKAAELYQQQIKTVLPFDLVLNGIGEDGHTASLFPNQLHQALPEQHKQQSVIAVFDSPKPPSERVSLSYKTLSATLNSFILITGASKYPAVTLWKQGKQLPINQLCAINKVNIYIDQSALTGK